MLERAGYKGHTKQRAAFGLPLTLADAVGRGRGSLGRNVAHTVID